MIFWPDVIIPDSGFGLTGPNNIYIYIYIYIFVAYKRENE